MFKKGDLVELSVPNPMDWVPKVPNGVQAEVDQVWYVIRYGNQTTLVPSTYVDQVRPKEGKDDLVGALTETLKASVKTPKPAKATPIPLEVLPSMEAAPDEGVPEVAGEEGTGEVDPIPTLMAALQAAHADPVHVPLLAEHELNIDGVDHICYTLQDGADLVSVARPKRKGRPSYKKIDLLMPVPEQATQVPANQLPPMAKKVFAEAGYEF